MGGDNFPSTNIDGVLDYLDNALINDIYFILVGNKSLIEKYLNNKNISIINLYQ